MSTLLLTHSDVVRHLDALTLLSDMREAFRTDALARTVAPQRASAPLHAEGSAQVLFPGALPGVPTCSVRVETLFPGQSPPGQGVVQLHDVASGALLAVMDSGHLTALRIGVVGALAADVLARPDARRVALLGAGKPGVLALKSLRLVRTLEHVRVFDETPGQPELFAARMYQELKLPVRVADSVAEAVADADIIVTSTRMGATGDTPGARQPLLHPGMVRPGTHITALGSDAPGRGELSAELLQQAKLICDSRSLAATSGAVGGAGLTESVIHAELGEILAGLKPGRASPEELTVFTPVGMAFQDLAVAWHVYLGAKEDESVRRLDFLA